MQLKEKTLTFPVIYFLKGTESLNLYGKIILHKRSINYEILKSLGLSNIKIFISNCKQSLILEKQSLILCQV